MRNFSLPARRAGILAVAMATLALSGIATAARAEDFFIPGQAKTPSTGAAARAPAKRAPHQPPVQIAPPTLLPPATSAELSDQQRPAMVPLLPPAPDLPALAKGPAPPVAVVGVMGVPEVMRALSAAQQIERTIGQRREKLNTDAQKEQATWRELQQSLVSDRAKLTPEQIHTRERELQDRISNSQRQFRDRGRIIQDSAQYALAQIERTLIAVIRQVAESRGMNLVLHRAQVALNIQEFDITEQVTEQMNKIVPTVVIPPDGVEPPSQPATAQAPAASGVSATAPGAPPPKPAN